MKSSSALRVVSKIAINLSERNCLPSSLFPSHRRSTFNPPKMQTSMLSTFKPPKLDTSIFQRSFTCSYVPSRYFHLSTTTSVSYYETLGVSPTATQQEVKDAFYRLSKELHPSKNPDSPDAAEKFDKLLAAYGVIGNPKRRYFHLSTTTSVSYYETLGVSPTATQQEVKDAFYRLSKELHPSKNPDLPDAAEKFDKLLAAYGVIGNPKRRKRYNRRYYWIWPLAFVIILAIFGPYLGLGER